MAGLLKDCLDYVFSFSPIFSAMIAFLKGEFSHKSPTVVQMDVGGVGYELQISLNTYSRIEKMDKGLLLTYLQVREDAHVL